MPKATHGLGGDHHRTEADTDARQDEYTTYAPSGETCPECERKIESLEQCRRISGGRSSAGRTVRYRHLECLDRVSGERGNGHADTTR